MLIELFIVFCVASGVVSFICGGLWYFTNEDIFMIIALICGLFFISVLLLFVSSLAEWTGQVIQEWINQTILI